MEAATASGRRDEAMASGCESKEEGEEEKRTSRSLIWNSCMREQ